MVQCYDCANGFFGKIREIGRAGCSILRDGSPPLSASRSKPASDKSPTGNAFPITFCQVDVGLNLNSGTILVVLASEFCVYVIGFNDEKLSKENICQTISVEQENGPGRQIQAIQLVSNGVLAVGLNSGTLCFYCTMSGNLLGSVPSAEHNNGITSLKMTAGYGSVGSRALWCLYCNGNIFCVTLSDLLDFLEPLNCMGGGLRRNLWRHNGRQSKGVDFVCTHLRYSNVFKFEPTSRVMKLIVAGANPAISGDFIEIDAMLCSLDMSGPLPYPSLTAAVGRFISGGIESVSSTSKTRDAAYQKFNHVPRRKFYEESFAENYERKGISLCLSPSGKIVVMTDNLGRVLLYDTRNLNIIRVMKGYREAQCGWISTEPQISQSCSLASKKMDFLVIFAPQRSIIEIWHAVYGIRISQWSDSSLRGGHLVCKQLLNMHSRCFFIRWTLTNMRNAVATNQCDEKMDVAIIPQFSIFEIFLTYEPKEGPTATTDNIRKRNSAD